ncbi:MAG: pilus assembly FimT family protein [Thermodesulfobacteriota bacterium]
MRINLFYKNIHTHGFTLVELVMVIVLLGILSFYAVPRFVDVLDFERSGFYQELASATRYANRLAVGRGDKVRIKFANDKYALYYYVSGSFEKLPKSHPVHEGKYPNNVNVDSGNNNLPVNATFTALGNCEDCNGDLTITVDGRKMTIFEQTGYVNATS